MEQIIPLIRNEIPACSVAVVGRTPPESVLAYAQRDPLVKVTGTVPDIRPYLWNSAVSIVPLRIGGGTRLKIYESMAAKIPVVSTTIGAEGLLIHPPTDIRIADTPEAFARECVTLIRDRQLREGIAHNAWQMVSDRFSWEKIAQNFEDILASAEIGAR
jgi:glycosyltransferase involved in cell wall biosynthesis